MCKKLGKSLTFVEKLYSLPNSHSSLQLFVNIVSGEYDTLWWHLQDLPVHVAYWDALRKNISTRTHTHILGNKNKF